MTEVGEGLTSEGFTVAVSPSMRAPPSWIESIFTIGTCTTPLAVLTYARGVSARMRMPRRSATARGRATPLAPVSMRKGTSR